MYGVITFDSNAVAATPKHEIGTLHMRVHEDDAEETLEALIALGFKPSIEYETR